MNFVVFVVEFEYVIVVVIVGDKYVVIVWKGDVGGIVEEFVGIWYFDVDFEFEFFFFVEVGDC